MSARYWLRVALVTGLAAAFMGACAADDSPLSDVPSVSTEAPEASDGLANESPASSDDPSITTESFEASDELDDGSYSCEAGNDTRGNGPYDLECDKYGDVITLAFPNGGHIDLDIDSQVRVDEDTWEFETTHSESGDSWTVTIDR